MAIQLLDRADRRIAFDVSGDGPWLVAPAWWVSHLEAGASDARYARFWRDVSAGYTLVRYDRLGVGLSDRTVESTDFTLDAELDSLQALVDHLGVERAALLGGSSGGCTAIAFAARHPARVERLFLYGAFARGADIAPPDVRAAVLAAVRSHWGLGSRLLAQIFVGDEGSETFARLQRVSADAETAAQLLEFVYGVDVSDDVPRVETPAVVAHRRADRAVPYALGRALAAALPNATFVPLAGGGHLPWYGDGDAVVRALRSDTSVSDGAPEVLSEREREVLALVARGLTDAEIAEQLVLSPHTVHRHVANMRRKLGSTSRTAAVAEAARLGLL